MKIIRKANKVFLRMSRQEWIKVGKHGKWIDHPSQHEEVFEAGKIAAQRGKSVNDNPYMNPNTIEHKIWIEGFEVGKPF